MIRLIMMTNDDCYNRIHSYACLYSKWWCDAVFQSCLLLWGLVYGWLLILYVTELERQVKLIRFVFLITTTIFRYNNLKLRTEVFIFSGFKSNAFVCFIYKEINNFVLLICEFERKKSSGIASYKYQILKMAWIRIEILQFYYIKLFCSTIIKF